MTPAQAQSAHRVSVRQLPSFVDGHFCKQGATRWVVAVSALGHNALVAVDVKRGVVRLGASVHWAGPGLWTLVAGVTVAETHDTVPGVLDQPDPLFDGQGQVDLTPGHRVTVALVTTVNQTHGRR